MKQVVTLAALVGLAAVPAAAWSQELEPVEPDPEPEAPYGFQGTVLSVDSEAGTIVARVEVAGGPFSGPEPLPFTAAFRTGADTELLRNARPAKLAELCPGDVLTVAIRAQPARPRQQVIAGQALAVAAFSHPAFYGFAGRVREVDAETGSITVAVRYATRDARRLLDGDERRPTLTFTIDEDSEIIRHGTRVKARALRRGDLLGIAVLANRDAFLGEVLAIPARVVAGRRLPHMRPAPRRGAHPAEGSGRRRTMGGARRSSAWMRLPLQHS